MPLLLRKIFFRDAPPLRFASLFLCWGAFYFIWMQFMLWTSIEQLQEVFTHYDVICPIAILLLLLGMGGLFLTHLHGLVFRPYRAIRLFLWLLSLLILGIWVALPFVDEKVIEIVPGITHIGGRIGLLVAFFSQLSADTLHLFCKWRLAGECEQNKMKRSIATGLSIAIFPLVSVMLPFILSPFYAKVCKNYGEELRRLRNYPSQTASKAILNDWDAFKKTEQELKNAWTSGDYLKVFTRWEDLQIETSSKWWLERRRLQLLPSLLREGIPDDSSLCQRILEALLLAEPAMNQPEREFVLWCSDVSRQALIDTGPFGEDECFVDPILRTHFLHCKKPLAEVPLGLERLWHYLLLRRIDEFYALKLKSLDTPLDEMVKLEVPFDRWLASIPWNYDEYAPNTKCMDGVGVHINRYFDLYTMQFWQADCREAYVGIALHQYRLLHGEWPATLDKLVPEFLPKLPLDPFTNSSLKTAKHPKYPDTLTVYSERKQGTDSLPNELLCRGFPVAKSNTSTHSTEN